MSLRGQEQLDFGTGHFVGPLYGDPEFVFHFDDPEGPDIASQARFVGYANGCPVSGELIDPETGRGPEAMLNRYGEVNFWFVHITEMAASRNPDLYDQLVSPVPRRDDEPVGKHEPLSVHEDYDAEIPPMGTLPGWALPRLFIKYLGGEDQTVEETQHRLENDLNILDRAVLLADSPAELLALLAEGVSQCKEGLTTDEVLQGVLSLGWLEEHNAVSMITEVKEALSRRAPEVWEAYSRLSADEKAELKIA
jgi:hypothetical protein